MLQRRRAVRGFMTAFPISLRSCVLRRVSGETTTDAGEGDWISCEVRKLPGGVTVGAVEAALYSASETTGPRMMRPPGVGTMEKGFVLATPREAMPAQ